MTIKQQIDQDLKAALLDHNTFLTTVLRGIKSSILNEEIAQNKRDEGLSEENTISLLQKEVKKRLESAELYKQGNSNDRAESELAEKEIIEEYLPAQMSDEELNKFVEEAIKKTGANTMQQMGQVIGMVRATTNGQADGGRIAAAVKGKLSQ